MNGTQRNWSGLDELQTELADAQPAFAALDGEIATVSFDPNHPESIQAAIDAMEAAIDSKVAPYRGNALVEGIVPELKEKYRAAILERCQPSALHRMIIGDSLLSSSTYTRDAEIKCDSRYRNGFEPDQRDGDFHRSLENGRSD